MPMVLAWDVGGKMEPQPGPPTADSAPPPGAAPVPWLAEGGIGASDPPAGAMPRTEAPAAAPRGPRVSGHVDRRELDGKRVRARLIDGFLVGIPCYLVGEALTRGEPRVVGFGLGLAFVLTYFFICEALTGRTLGKRLMGLRVMSFDYRPAEANAVAARTVLRALEEPFLALIAMFASRKRRQRIGDFAGRTIVARADECLERPAPSHLLVVYPVLWIGAVLILSATLGGSSPGERDRAAFEAGLRGSLVAQGTPAPMVDCIVAGSRAAVSDADLLRLGASVPYLASRGLGAVPRPLRARILETDLRCARQTGYLDQLGLPDTPGRRRQYVTCVERHAQPAGMEACATRFASAGARSG